MEVFSFFFENQIHGSCLLHLPAFENRIVVAPSPGLRLGLDSLQAGGYTKW